MSYITISTEAKETFSLVSNHFIDYYMTEANGEFVKVYLYLIRLLSSKAPISVADIADHFNLTEKDICRAIRYWISEDVLRLDYDASGQLTGITLLPLHEKTKEEADTSLSLDSISLLKFPEKKKKPAVPAASKPVHTKNTISGPEPVQKPASVFPEKQPYSAALAAKAKEDDAFADVIFEAETYFRKELSVNDIEILIYIHDQLGFSTEIMEYLIEYCVSRGKKSVRYIESVAINWYQQGITSVQEAKEQSTLYSQNVFPIMKAFGISNRDPGSAELDYIKKWNSLGLGTDIIIEACSRTLLATHQASFPYANKILEDWKRLGVRNTSDIKHLDDKHRSTASSSSGSDAGYTQGQPRKGSTGAAARKNTATNQFHNFEQRTYDFNDLESRLLDKTRR